MQLNTTEVYKFIVVSNYCTSDRDKWIFLDYLWKILLHLLKWTNFKIVTGKDVNVRFNVTTDKWSITMLLDLLRQFNTSYHNDQLTCDNACLDNVFSNIDKVDV